MAVSPLTINATGLNGGDVEIAGDLSTNFNRPIDGGAACKGQREYPCQRRVSFKPYIDITLALMAQFGVTVINHDYARLRLLQASVMYHQVKCWSKVMRHRHRISSPQGRLRAVKSKSPVWAV